MSAMRIATIVVASVLALSAPVVLAHEGHMHHLMGVVKAMDATHLEIDTKDSGVVSVVIDKDTKYQRDKSQIKNSDVKVGDRVVIEAMETGGKNMAHKVTLGSMATHEEKESEEAHTTPHH